MTTTHSVQQVIMRDQWDGDIFHIGYRWPSLLEGEYHHRTASAIHIDDIESVFGERFRSEVNEIKPGDIAFIHVHATCGDTESQ